MVSFPLRCEGDPILRHIFPSKQKAAGKVIELAKRDPRIRRVFIFGSAVTMDCGAGSDLDIAIDAPGITEGDEFVRVAGPFLREVPSEVDVLHLNAIRSDLLLDAVRKGVCVYDRDGTKDIANSLTL